MSSDGLRKNVENRLWKAGLSVSRPTDQRLDLIVAQYPGWRLRCHQVQHWFLWRLYDDSQAESPDPAGHFALVTVDRRDNSEVATFQLDLLEAWLDGQNPFVIPRRKRRLGFAHHSLLQEIQGDLPMLISAEDRKPVLVSVSLQTLKQWMEAFPPPGDDPGSGSGQLDLALWTKSHERGPGG